MESLIQLIGLMDKHVLDSANLLINSVPVSLIMQYVCSVQCACSVCVCSIQCV